MIARPPACPAAAMTCARTRSRRTAKSAMTQPRVSRVFS